MNEPQLFGRPSSHRSAPWPPAARTTSSAVEGLEMSAPPARIRFDWKFFAIAAVLAAIVVAILFAFSSATAETATGVGEPGRSGTASPQQLQGF